MNPDLTVCSRDIYLIKQSMGAYVINLEEYSETGTHWIVLHALNNNLLTLIVFELMTF